MADLSDVNNALLSLVSGAIYPNGSAPGAGYALWGGFLPRQIGASVVAANVRIFVGWPQPAQVDADMAAGAAQISIYPRTENRNTTRYMYQWQQASLNTATLTLTIAGQTVTVGGTVPPAGNPHNVVVLAGYTPYVYAVQPTDTLASIAASLAALIAVGIPGTTSSGPVITLPNATLLLAARVGISGASANEILREEQVYQVGVWAPNPTLRDSIAAAIKLVLAATPRLTLADNSSARLIYKSSLQSDKLQKQLLFRRDIFCTIEYAGFQTETDTQITQTQLNVSAAPAGVTPYQPVQTFYD